MSKTGAVGGKVFLALVCSLLLAFQPVWGAPAPAPIGRVSGPGPVELNGIAAPTGTIVYAGNRVTTGAQAIGYVSLARGGRLVIGRSTSARIDQDGKGFTVQLDRGVVGAVSEASGPIVVMAGGVTIRPKQASGVYEVALNGNALKVLANHGSMMAEGASRTVEVPEGKVMDASVSPPQGQSFTGTGDIVLISLLAAAGLGIGLGVALSGQGKTCASSSQLNCQ
ncbi:MAG TPA: hypothetical protein VGS20_04635 [Candidatus Acidoferrales bacterium]|nr:hypothetical protein [Candidatus Acidoferrales bacterium]